MKLTKAILLAKQKIANSGDRSSGDGAVEWWKVIYFLL
jgi:hypothetical protein